MPLLRRSTIRPAVFAAAVLGAVSLALALPASGGPGDPTLPPLQLSAVAGPPGSSFTVSGTGCTIDVFPLGDPAPGQVVSVTVAFAPTPVTMTTTAADGTGAWSLTFTVPPGTAPGPYPVTATCSFAAQNGGAATITASVVAFQTPSVSYPAATYTVTAVPVPVVAAPRTTG